MRKSSVYLFVALTLMSLGLALVPDVFCQINQAQDMKILSYSYYVDNQGILDVVGEVQNQGPNTVFGVLVTGSVIDNTGTDQGDTYATIGIDPMSILYLSPNQIAPFYLEFWAPNNSPDGTWATVTIASIELAVAEANATTSYQYPGLTVSSSKSYIGNTVNDTGVYWVTGNVQNTGSQTAENVTVFGTFYNSTGSVVAVGYSNTDASLSSSASESFQLGAFDINQTGIITSEKITKYSLLIQADGPILQGTGPLITPSPGSSNTPSPGSSSSPASTTSPTQGSSSSPSSTPATSANSNSNNSSNLTAIYAVAIVVVLIVVVGTILVMKSRKPPETVKQARKARNKRTD